MVTNRGGCKNNRLMKCLLTHLPWPHVTVEGADKVKAVPRADVAKAGGGKTYAKAVTNNIPAAAAASASLSVVTTPPPHSSSSSASTPASAHSYDSNATSGNNI